MKTFKLYTKLLGMAVAGGFLLSACSESFLETDTYTEKNEETFYQTPEDAFEGLVAIYDNLQRAGYGHFILTSEIISDNCFGGFGKTDNTEALEWNNFMQTSNPNLNRSLWQIDYQGIYRANVVLEKLEQVEWGDQQDLKTRYEAEARFLRAHFHFELARVFGNIVAVDRVIRDKEEYKMPQSSPEEIYALIASDFQFAAENLGDVSNEDFGRASKWAAEAYLAKAFLFYTDYYEQSDLAGVVSKDEVISYLEDLINNSNHDLLADFSTLWPAASGENYAGEDNNEFIWSVKYVNKGNDSWDFLEGNTWNVMIGLRNQIHPPYSKGWGAAPVRAELYQAYETGDTRRDATIIGFDEEGIPFDASDQRQYTGYAWKKYIPTASSEEETDTEADGGDFQRDNPEDYIVLRFADVLLMAAELNLDVNTGKAQQYFNRVRERAFGNATRNKTVSKEAILEERRLELALEGHRYWDLIRDDLGTAKNAIDYTGGEEEFNTSFRPETGGFLAIPYNQIQLSGGTLEQNEGW